MKAERTVKQHLRTLRRECIEGSDDRIESRVAQAMEYAVRWAREDVRGWPNLADEARQLAAILKSEIANG